MDHNKKPKRQQSMMNNLKAVPGDRFRAGEAKFKVSGLKALTGRSEQSLIAALVLYAFDNMPEFGPFRDRINQGWEEFNNQK